MSLSCSISLCKRPIPRSSGSNSVDKESSPSEKCDTNTRITFGTPDYKLLSNFALTLVKVLKYYQHIPLVSSGILESSNCIKLSTRLLVITLRSSEK